MGRAGMTKEEAFSVITASGIKSGQLWQHYKNGLLYRITATALDEKTLVPLVVYEACYQDPMGRNVTWVRSLVDFISTVETPEGLLDRFSSKGFSSK